MAVPTKPPKGGLIVVKPDKDENYYDIYLVRVEHVTTLKQVNVQRWITGDGAIHPRRSVALKHACKLAGIAEEEAGLGEGASPAESKDDPS